MAVVVTAGQERTSGGRLKLSEANTSFRLAETWTFPPSPTSRLRRLFGVGIFPP